MDRMLIVEPDEVQAEIFTLALSERFKIEHVNDFTEAVAKLNSHSYEMIITEWEVNAQTAIQLKPFTDKNNPKHLPIIVVISDDGSEATMKLAYDNGISYFLTKPYNILQFSETVIGLQNYISVVKEVKDTRSHSSDTTKTALNQAAIYGTGMELVANISGASEPRDIARKVLRSLKLNGVIAAIQFRNGDHSEQYDYNAEPCDETTTKVFKVLRDQGRIYQFGRRIMFNDTAISLLIIQVAQNDPKLYDDILDMGAKLIPALNTQYQKMLQQQVLSETNNEVKETLQKMHVAMLRLGKDKREMIDNVSEMIKAGFHQLALSEEQESYFIDVIERELKSRDDMEFLVELDADMKSLAERLSNRIVDLNIGADEEVEDDDFQELEFF